MANILIFNDDSTTLDVFRARFENEPLSNHTIIDTYQDINEYNREIIQDQIESNSINLVLMDKHFSQHRHDPAKGLSFARWIKEINADVKVLLVTNFDNRNDFYAAYIAGNIDGYLKSNRALDISGFYLKDAIEDTLNDGMGAWDVPIHWLDVLIENNQLRVMAENEIATNNPDLNTESPVYGNMLSHLVFRYKKQAELGLTRMQFNVFCLEAAGVPKNEIRNRLGIAQGTHNVYRHQIMNLLEKESPVEFLALAIKVNIPEVVGDFNSMIEPSHIVTL